MTKDKDNNIISIRQSTGSISGATPAEKSPSKYILPGTFGNLTEYYLLPNNEAILHDFRLAGGNFKKFVDLHCGGEGNPTLFALQVVEQIEADPEAAEEFQKTRTAAERMMALLARDEIAKISTTPKSQSQLAALKLVQEFAKDHPPAAATKDKIDDHLEAFGDSDA